MLPFYVLVHFTNPYLQLTIISFFTPNNSSISHFTYSLLFYANSFSRAFQRLTTVIIFMFFPCYFSFKCSCFYIVLSMYPIKRNFFLSLLFRFIHPSLRENGCVTLLCFSLYFLFSLKGLSKQNYSWWLFKGHLFLNFSVTKLHILSTNFSANFPVSKLSTFPLPVIASTFFFSSEVLKHYNHLWTYCHFRSVFCFYHLLHYSSSLLPVIVILLVSVISQRINSEN